MTIQPARHIGIGIERPFAEAYEFLAAPANFPQWASGLGHSFEPAGGLDWRAQTPMGPMMLRFSARNEHGVLDHSVIPESGAPMLNPMRLLANGEGCELVFTLYRRNGVTDEEYERDAAWVAHDLAGLKALLESGGGLRA
jgi:hypothetical protein